jgi:hypothetical protein
MGKRRSLIHIGRPLQMCRQGVFPCTELPKQFSKYHIAHILARPGREIKVILAGASGVDIVDYTLQDDREACEGVVCGYRAVLRRRLIGLREGIIACPAFKFIRRYFGREKAVRSAIGHYIRV